MRWWVATPLVVFAGLVGVFGYMLLSGRDPSILPSALIDQPVPVFDLPPLHDGGEGLATADFGGRVVLVNVFASWCVPCRAEHPLLMDLAENEGVPVFGLNYKNARPDAEGWLTELGDPYERIGYDYEGQVAIDWGVYGVPETFVVDAEGRIRHKHVGPLMPADVAETILPMVRALAP